MADQFKSDYFNMPVHVSKSIKKVGENYNFLIFLIHLSPMFNELFYNIKSVMT